MTYLHLATIHHHDRPDSHFVSLDGRAWENIVGRPPEVEGDGFISRAVYSEIKRIYFLRPMIFGVYLGLGLNRTVLESNGGKVSWQKAACTARVNPPRFSSRLRHRG
jgi:hypothetical protein